MTRIVSYNILAGGYNLREKGIRRRTNELVKIIRSAQPDVVGLVEATNAHMTSKPLVIDEMAEQLGMQLIMGGDPAEYEYQVACLTHLPVIYSRTHVVEHKWARTMLEVCVEEANGQHLTVFVVHLSAAFSSGWAGTSIREREVQELLKITQPHRENAIPHLIMGDFNTLAPGDAFKASFLLRYIVGMDEKRNLNSPLHDGHPYLNFVVPPRLRFLAPLLRLIPQSTFLSSVFDMAASLYVPRKPIAMLQEAGYVDSYRQTHPRTPGFTCPAAASAGRIDFIFASPALEDRLIYCHEIVQGEDGVLGTQASDHLAVTAEFVEMPASPKAEEVLEMVALQ